MLCVCDSEEAALLKVLQRKGGWSVEIEVGNNTLVFTSPLLSCSVIVGDIPSSFSTILQLLLLVAEKRQSKDSMESVGRQGSWFS